MRTSNTCHHKRPSGTGSLKWDRGRAIALAPREQGGPPRRIGSFQTMREAERALAEWLRNNGRAP